MKILTVTELTFAIKSVLEPQFRGISVKGEISNFKLQTSGHLYFSLKDAGAQISAVLFKGNAAQLSRLPKEGDQVIALGELSIYAPRGGYQMVIKELQFLGVGELLMRLHQLKETLNARGWFDPAKKKPLPKLPKRIGVITSPTGAVIQDILHILTRRFKGFQVVLNPVKVQGEGSAQEIAQAIDDFNRYDLADVLIVGRGGGSIEDLWAFNEEIVAKAIFESKIPIISAVGHETDFTIADLVADVRAPTPSAAAEIAIAEKANLLKFLASVEAATQQRIVQQINFARQKIASLQKHPLFSSPYATLAPYMQRLDDLQSDIQSGCINKLEQKKQTLLSYSKQLALLEPSQKIGNWKAQLKTCQERLHLSIQAQVKNKEERLKSFTDQLKSVDPTQKIHTLITQLHSIQERLLLSVGQVAKGKEEKLKAIAQHLTSINPQNLLKKGYSILFAENDSSVILSAKQLTPKQTIKALLHDGKITVTVDAINEN
jgi:exodeoxyribonuclease VII large subunit